MKLGNTDVKVGSKEFKQRRFLSVICGIASAGAMITGDLFNFTLFMALIGIVNIGIVSAVRQVSVLNSAFNYGLIAMMCSFYRYLVEQLLFLLLPNIKFVSIKSNACNSNDDFLVLY